MSVTITANDPTAGSNYSISVGSIAVECTTTGNVDSVEATLGMAMPVVLNEDPVGTWKGSLDISNEQPGEQEFKAVANEMAIPAAETKFNIDLVT